MHFLIPSFRHGEPYPRRADRCTRFRVDADNAGREWVAWTASLLKAGDVNGSAAATAWFIHHGWLSGGWRPADLVRDREETVLGRALEVSGSMGGLVPRDPSGMHGLQKIKGRLCELCKLYSWSFQAYSRSCVLWGPNRIERGAT